VYDVKGCGEGRNTSLAPCAGALKDLSIGNATDSGELLLVKEGVMIDLGFSSHSK